MSLYFERRHLIIFIIKSQKLTTGGRGICGVLIKLINQNFSESKFLHESTELENFQWGYKFRGVKILDISSLGFQQLSYL